jgi:hypothetical protein
MRSLLFKLRIFAGKYVHVGERDHWGTKGVRAAYRQLQLVNWQLFSANMTIAAMNRIAKLVCRRAHVLLATPCHAYFSLKAVARVTSLVSRCISIAPAMLDRYLAA